VRHSYPGEGIHTAMVAGKIAAHSVSDMFERCNFTLEACRAYGERCALLLSSSYCCYLVLWSV
jgi:flavin-dependent dehydrogenase